ncbi:MULTISPECIES: hypothetical protein [Paenibacillus]|uniref:hypothetical protein n=1 Tax=Paenibacillus TaxID=44249 RepID=UPI002FE1E2CE
MKKLLKSVMLATVVSALVLSSQAIAAPTSERGGEELMRETNKILRESGALTQKDRLEELKKLGWEVQTSEGNDSISPQSLPGDGKVTNYFMRNPDKPGTYLVEVLWDYTGTNNTWDTTSGSAYDFLGIAITDENGRSVNAQGTNGGIVMQDKDYTKYTNGASLYSYQNSGATYTFADNYAYGQGMHGYAWFYITKPTSGKSYYMKSQWVHTWNTLSATLTSLTLSYPFSLNATFTRTPSQWGVSDQDSVVFN